MSATEWVVVVGGALVGFGVVSWILTVIEQQKRPPVSMDTQSNPMRLPAAPESRPADVRDTWHTTLGVSADATAVEIENAYHSRIAECDRVRFDTTASVSDRQSAEARRAEVSSAFEFIRPLKN
jgi:hypothetical protein